MNKGGSRIIFEREERERIVTTGEWFNRVMDWQERGWVLLGVSLENYFFPRRKRGYFVVEWLCSENE